MPDGTGGIGGTPGAGPGNASAAASGVMGMPMSRRILTTVVAVVPLAVVGTGE